MIEDNHLDKGQPENIVIKGARVHNLKNIDIDVHYIRSWVLPVSLAQVNRH